jgi:transposase
LIVGRETVVGRSVGLDVHREFCEVAVSDGGSPWLAGRVGISVEQLQLLAERLEPSDRVVLEATGNALAIARILAPDCAEVLLGHSKRLRAIGHAKVNTDKLDARVLAELLAANLIPAVLFPDEPTRRRRRQISRRRALVKRSTAVKNEISAVLIRNLKRRPEATDVSRAGLRLPRTPPDPSQAAPPGADDRRAPRQAWTEPHADAQDRRCPIE